MSPHEETELIAEKELYELFERRRPDAADFLAGVERRVAERERADESGDGEGADKPTNAFLRRVAALDPTGGALVGSAFGTKLLPTALALPAMLLLSVVGGFVASARSIAGNARSAPPGKAGPRRPLAHKQKAPNREMATGARMLAGVQSATLIAFILTPLIGGRRAIDVLLIALVVAMASLVLSLRGFARAGLMVRSEAARLGLAVLGAVLGYFVWFHAMRIGTDTSTLGIGWSAAVVLLGTATCLIAAWREIPQAWVYAAVLVAFVFMNTLGVTNSSPSALRSQWTALGLQADDLENWREAAAIYEALEVVGADLPDTSAVRRELDRALADETIDVQPHVWTAAELMGLVTADDWRQLATRGTQMRAVDKIVDEGRVSPTDFNEYKSWMALAVRPPSPEERERILNGIEEIWPTQGDHAALDKASYLLRLLEELDPVRANARRDDVRELLLHYWMPDEKAGFFSNPGGFTSNPAKLRTSFDDDTWYGIQLMARYGVPEGIDLRETQGYLRRESQAFMLGFDIAADLNAFSRASLLRLEREIGLPPRTWFEHLVAERLLIACVLLVSLCLLAVRLAPRDDEAVGAQP